MNTVHKRPQKKGLKRLRQKLHIPNQSVRLVVTFVCLLLFAKLVEKNVLFPRFDDRHAQKIQQIFTGKEHSLLQHIDILAQCTKDEAYDSCFIVFHEQYAASLKKHGLYLFVYRNDTLDYWSTKDVAITKIYSSSELGKPYVSLGNNKSASGKYASFVRKHGRFTIVGLVLIKEVYVYENKYLKTAFQKDFDLPASVKIFPGPEANSYPIVDSNGQFMWSLIFDNTCFYHYQLFVPALLYLLAILVLFMLLDSVFHVLRTATFKNLYLPILALLLLAIRYAMLHWDIPGVFSELGVFNPIYFGVAWFPSFGELTLWCIFISFFVFELYRHLRFPLFYERRWKYFVYVAVSLVIVVVGFFAIGVLLKALVINSSDIFEGPNRILLLNGFSLLGYSVIMLFLFSFCLLLDRTMLLCKQEFTFSQFLISYVIVLSLVIIGWSIAGLHVSLTSIFFLTVIVYLWGSLRLKKSAKIKYSYYILLVFLLALYTSTYINRYSFEKYEDQKETLVTNLATQHDLTAEFLLRNVTERIISDTSTMYVDLAYKDFRESNNFPNLLNYIKKQHFYASYWDQYMSRCLVCADTSRLEITEEKKRVDNCSEYFSYLTDTHGTKVSRTEFWYIDRPDVWSYLGWFRVGKNGELPLQIFIELWPGGTSDEVGYPELLLDERLTKGNNLKGYSYAKYHNNRRLTQYGSFKYNLKDDIFQGNKSNYHTVNADGMEHLVYRPDKNNMIVLSSYSPKAGDLIINFSYIFIFFFIVVSICLLIIHLPAIRRGFQWNFRNKIQYSMIAIMLVSFAIISVFTVIYVNRQYQYKNNDIINEKIQAIHSELQDAFLFQKGISDKWEDNKDKLADWLSNYKRLFFTDINLFDVNGQLIATSLPDVFDRGLVGRQINPDAFIKLAFKQRASILEHESIGGMRYISAYEPIVDKDNKVIAFLNLPYFTQQDALTDEISNVIVALLNFYMVIILLTVIISIMMSNQITQPLIMLQEKFRNIRLGEKNDPISYESHDEVGGLVKEYNRAIDELAKSATRLARSERESAWREMAKQIAHEINNPLTPMKLSIQHLKRAYDNRSERFDEYMEKISRSLVEQIDTLSSIATEFSNFAKMPATQNQQIDLIAKINNVVPLFAVDENKRAFHSDFHGLKHAMVCADKEQISRVFINLFKNALQAIPKDRQAEIHIDVLKINHIIWVRIKDNGTGIPDEMQEKIFRPNFTTKSSGMGMGLAIVRNIIESAGGTINFKTRQGEGTTFIISLPAAE